MLRLIAYNVLLFAIPFAAYGLFLFATRGNATNASDWSWRTLGLLVLAGVVVMTIGLVILTSFSGAPPGQTYRPAEVRDGQLVPGGFE